MSRIMQKAVETKAGKTGVAKTKGRGKGERIKEIRRKEAEERRKEEKEIKKEEDNRSGKSGRGIGDLG